MNTRRRSLLKAVTWRLIAMLVLAVVSFAITGSVRDGGLITGVYTVIAVVLFYTHERAWERIGWGKR